jgi:hypothetical protein
VFSSRRPCSAGIPTSICQKRRSHRCGTRYYLNSEGFKTVAPIHRVARDFAEAQADDGMPVRETYTAVERAVADLPAQADLVARARALAAE